MFIYINQVANVRWNGMFSDIFSMKNGVRQGAVLSASLQDPQILCPSSLKKVAYQEGPTEEILGVSISDTKVEKDTSCKAA